MTVVLSPSGWSQNGINLNVGVTGAVPASIDIQYATRSDFQFCIAPIITVAPNSPLNLGGFNRAQTYWFRGREVAQDGGRAPWGVPVGVTTSPGDTSLPDYGVQISPALIGIPMRPSGIALRFGTAVDGYSIGNLLRPSPVAAWRVFFNGGVCGFVVETDGAAYDTVALLETNLPEGATIKIAGGDTAAAAVGGSPAFSYGPSAFRASANVGGRRGYHSLVRLPGAVSSRFLYVEIGGVAPPGGLVHITHLVVTQARVIKNYSDMTDQSLDLSTLDRQRDGSPDAVYGFRGRKVDFDLAVMTERQHEASFADLAGRVGLSEPVLVVPNSRAGAYLHDRILYGNLSVNRMTNSNARFTRSLSIESIINP